MLPSSPEKEKLKKPVSMDFKLELSAMETEKVESFVLSPASLRHNCYTPSGGGSGYNRHDDVTRQHDDVTRQHDDVTRHYDDVTRNYDDVTKHQDDMSRHHDDVIRCHRPAKYGNSSKLVQALLADSERLKMSSQLRATKVIRVSEVKVPPGTTSGARSRNVGKKPVGCRRSRKYDKHYVLINFYQTL